MSSLAVAIEGVVVAAQEAFAVLFLILVLGTEALAIAVMAVLVRVMLFRAIVLPLVEVVPAGAQAVAIAGVKSDIGVTPVGVAAGILVTACYAVWIIGVLEAVDFRANRAVLEAIFVAVAVAVTVAALKTGP